MPAPRTVLTDCAFQRRVIWRRYVFVYKKSAGESNESLLADCRAQPVSFKKTVPDIACQSLCVNKKFDII